MSGLKDKIREIVEIVALVPDQFKTMCFEMLLKEAIAEQRPAPPPPPVPPAPALAPRQPAPAPTPPADAQAAEEIILGTQPKVSGGADIALTDLHMKTRKFMEKGELSIENLNELFYKEGDGFASLVTDLKVTTMAEAQVRIALLQALHNALDSGEFATTVETVREECKMRKTYDQSNFTAHLKKYAAYFDFGTYTKDTVDLKLTEQGRTQLAAVVKDLS